MNEDKIVEYLARMCFIIIVGVVLAVLLGMCSCMRTVYVPRVTAEHDSIYIATHTRDSVYLRDSIYIREKGDTVYLERWRTEYRDRIRTDTAYVERRDSIQVPYPVERKLSRKERLYMSAGRVAVPLAGAGIVLACLWIYRRKMT